MSARSERGVDDAAEYAVRVRRPEARSPGAREIPMSRPGERIDGERLALLREATARIACGVGIESGKGVGALSATERGARAFDERALGSKVDVVAGARDGRS